MVLHKMMSMTMLLSRLLLLVCLICCLESVEVDPKGYILYCPCMGRFGNQADHFLGSLGFAKAIDRTLVLPPWVEYNYVSPRSVQVPFDTYFKVEPLKKFHRVMTMESFMEELAPKIWPVGNRTDNCNVFTSVYCYQARTFGPKENDCNAKDGNPFGPFWDTFNIEFDRSEFYQPLYHDTTNMHDMQRWKQRYDPEHHPVLAFTGAPAQFPVQQNHVGLQQYLEWSNKYAELRDMFIKDHFGREKFVGIHLRLGSDFDNACRHLDESPMMFGAAQCLGFRMEHGRPSKEMCYQSEDTIVRDLGNLLKKTGIKMVFVATDGNDLISRLSERLAKFKLTFFKLDPPNPHLDLALLGAADEFIGNCISTFTAFVKRERDVSNKPSTFWDFPPKKRDEL